MQKVHTFQSVESFIKDYEDWKAGNCFVLIQKLKDGTKIRIPIRDYRYAGVKRNLIINKQYAGEIDLTHKFGKVCINP